MNNINKFKTSRKIKRVPRVVLLCKESLGYYRVSKNPNFLFNYTGTHFVIASNIAFLSIV